MSGIDRRLLLQQMLPALLALAAPPLAGAADEDAWSIPQATSEAFARQLQAALGRRDVGAVAALVRFPLRVNGPGQRRRLVARAQFAAQFDAVFPPAVVAKVLRQDPTDLFQRDQGVMFGDGELWAAADCGGRWRPGCPVRVTTVNLP